MLEKDLIFDQALAIFAECPDCEGLVLSYTSSHFVPPMRGDEELWMLTCDRCGAVFDVRGEELLVKSIPATWLLSKPEMAN